MVHFYGDIPNEVTAWTILDIINSDWLDERDKRVYSVTGNRYGLYFCKYILRQTFLRGIHFWSFKATTSIDLVFEIYLNRIVPFLGEILKKISPIIIKLIDYLKLSIRQSLILPSRKVILSHSQISPYNCNILLILLLLSLFLGCVQRQY